MSTQISSNNFPSPSPFSLAYNSNPPCACPPSSFPCPNPSPAPQNPEVWNYGFARAITFLQSPALGAGILAITFFLFIAFFSNGLLELVTPVTLGISVTLGTLGLIALLVLILFLL